MSHVANKHSLIESNCANKLSALSNALPCVKKGEAGNRGGGKGVVQIIFNNSREVHSFFYEVD